MRAFLLALAVVFANIAHFWNNTALDVSGYGSLGELLSIGYFDLSITFSNAAQLCLDGAVAAEELREQVDGLQDSLADALIESALGQAITAIWPTFPEFLDDPVEWLLSVLASEFPFLLDFLVDPEGWVVAILEAWLPIDIQASGFLSFEHEGRTFYGNDRAAVGSGFEFRIPAGSWTGVWASMYRYDAPMGRAGIDVFRDGELYASFAGELPPGSFVVVGMSIASEPDGLAVGGLWRVLANSMGSMAFASTVSLQPGEDQPGWGEASIQLVGAVGPASWTLDWSGFIDWVEDAFLDIAGVLYALLERIVRYFWEGVY